MRHTFGLARPVDRDLLNSLLGTNAANAALARARLDLHCLGKLALQRQLPLVKRDAVVHAPAREPGALAVLGRQPVHVERERVLLGVDLDLLHVQIRIADQLGCRLDEPRIADEIGEQFVAQVQTHGGANHVPLPSLAGSR